MARHPHKKIAAALKYVEDEGWSVVKSRRGHCWGVIRCPHGRGGCQKSIWSTPRNPEEHAKAIRRYVEGARIKLSEVSDGQTQIYTNSVGDF